MSNTLNFGPLKFVSLTMTNTNDVLVRIDELQWIQPPVCGGQIIETYYAYDADLEAICRLNVDRSEPRGRKGRVTLYRYDVPESWAEGSFDPANSEPEVGDLVESLEVEGCDWVE